MIQIIWKPQIQFQVLSIEIDNIKYFFHTIFTGKSEIYKHSIDFEKEQW